jgi:hypothetical protein
MMSHKRSSKNSKKNSNWKRYEKIVAKRRRARHIGGPGKPDYERGDAKGEVKCWNKPLSKGDVMKLVRKGYREIVSKSGFTEPAVRYIKRYRPYVKLFHGTKRIN